MNSLKRLQIISFILAVACVAGPLQTFAQTTLTPDLQKTISDARRVVNRTASLYEGEGRTGIRLDAREGDGAVWIPEVTFSEGVIEVDLKGKNVPQQSFVGVAFNGSNDSTYEAIYFRPFNFQSTDPDRRSHSVQYVAHPAYPWHRLREEHTGVYEKAISPAPDPEAWLHSRIVVDPKEVRVFVNGAPEPSLVVKRLVETGPGRVGLWVGNGSDGIFANLKVSGNKGE